jgi:hypothetical protein
MRRFLCASLISLLWPLAGTGRAQMPVIAIRDFRGPKAKPVRAGVVAALGKLVRVVKNPRAADHIIEGLIAHKGRKWTLTLTVRVAQSGSWVDDAVVHLSQPALSAVARKAVARKVMPLLQQGGSDDSAVVAGQGGAKPKQLPLTSDHDKSGAAAEFASEDGTQPSSDAKPASASASRRSLAKVKDDDPKEKQVAMAAAAEEPTSGTAVAKPAGETDLARPPLESPPNRSLGGDVLSLSAGATFQQRNFQAVGFGPLPTYTSDVYPSVYAAATLYPLGFTHSVVRNFGFFATFERALGLRSRVQATREILDTVAQRIEAGALFRIHIGGPAGPTFRPVALYGLQKFDIDGSTDMPNTDYEYFGGGLNADVPLFTPALALTASFQYHQIQSLGAAAGFGQTATAWGYAWEAGIRADLPWRLRALAVFTNLRRNASYTGLSMSGSTASEAHDTWTGGRVALAFDF